MNEIIDIESEIIPSYRDTSPKHDKLSEIIAALESETKEDYACRWNEMRVLTPDQSENGRISIKLRDEIELPFNRYFQGQMSRSLSPGLHRFGEELLQKGQIDLFAECHTRLLSLAEDDKKARIRTISNGMPKHARAFLSDAYKVIDDNAVFDAALPVINQYKDRFICLGGKRTDTKTYIKMISREPAFEIMSGGNKRVFHPGFIMSNSEVGQGYTEANPFLADKFCFNGCIWSKMDIMNVRFAHRGTRFTTDFGRLMGNNVKSLELCNIQGMIRDATELACSGEHYPALIEQIQEADQLKIKGDPLLTLQEVGKRVGLSKGEVEKLPLYFHAEERSLLGVNSAITRLAQEVKGYDRRIALEAAGGAALGMSAKAWAAVADLSN